MCPICWDVTGNLCHTGIYQETFYWRLIMAMGDVWEVLVIPATGCGRSYWESVTAINGMVAKKLVEARIPHDWKVGNNPKRV